MKHALHTQKPYKEWIQPKSEVWYDVYKLKQRKDKTRKWRIISFTPPPLFFNINVATNGEKTVLIDLETLPQGQKS